jgi:hypothetical protein
MCPVQTFTYVSGRTQRLNWIFADQTVSDLSGGNNLATARKKSCHGCCHGSKKPRGEGGPGASVATEVVS